MTDNQRKNYMEDLLRAWYESRTEWISASEWAQVERPHHIKELNKELDERLDMIRRLWGYVIDAGLWRIEA